MLWANLHLLFWLSLLPFTTGWMGENHFERWPTVLYGVNLLLCAMAYTVLQGRLIRHHGRDSLLATRGEERLQGQGFAGALRRRHRDAWTFSAWAGIVFYVIVALMWLVPDRRIERVVPQHPAH